MIRQRFSVNGYWEVVVYWDVDCNFFSSIIKDLRYIGFSRRIIRILLDDLCYYRAYGMTCSNLRKHTSVVLFNRHTSRREYMDTIVHEIEHIKQAMLEAYKVEDRGEPPAYTVGYLTSRMFSVFNRLLYCT